MKTRNVLSLMVILVVVLVASGCGISEYDNYDEPKSTLDGQVVFNGEAVGLSAAEPINLRNAGVELELWQPGYATREKIPVYIAQDGSFSAKLFDGDYKLTQLLGVGPWIPNSDSVDVKLNGDQSIQFEVDPYLVITDENIANNSGTIEGSVTIERLNPGADLEWVTMYFSGTNIVDHTNWQHFVNTPGSSVTLGSPVTLSQDISALPESLRNKDAVYVRIAVELVGYTEMVYSDVVKIPLN